MLKTEYGETDEDSKVIAEKVALGIAANGMIPTIYVIEEGNIEAILDIKADVIFNLIEWCGHDIYLSEKAFDCFAKLNIPVTGASRELFVLSGDKSRLKIELQKYGFPTPRGIYFETGNEDVQVDLDYPVIVKPAYEHCSTGLSYDCIAKNSDELKLIVKRQIDKFKQIVIAEEFIVGRELLVYLIEEDDGVKVLPIEEVIFSNHNPLAFQTYESKWVPGHRDYNTSDVVVSKLSSADQEIVEKTSIEIFHKLGFRGYARFDVRLKDGVPYMLETNANPSAYDGDGTLTDPEEEVIPGIKFKDYIGKIVRSAIKVFKDNHLKKTFDN